MTFPHNLRGLLTICVLLPLLYNCSIAETFDPDDVAALTLKLSAIPGQYERVFIDLSEVHVKVIDDENDPDCWWSISTSKAGIYDLQQFTEGRQLLLTEGSSLPTGKIYAIKLVLGNINYIISEGDRVDLFTNVIQLNNLNMPIDRTIARGNSYGLEVEMDLSASILEGPAEGQLILNPLVNYSFYDLKTQ